MSTPTSNTSEPALNHFGRKKKRKKERKKRKEKRSLPKSYEAKELQRVFTKRLRFKEANFAPSKPVNSMKGFLSMLKPT
jgi:hypothetical protein